MARPKKQTVDYFPHYVNASKSLAIVQAQYGNDGYAFWFKMLEIIGRTEAHFYDYSNEAAWLYFVTNTHVPETKAREILQTFASLGMIDKELWQKKIIWVQHFVDEHVALYARRTVDLPRRPGSPLPQIAPALLEAVEVLDKERDKIADMIKYYEDELGKMPTPNELEKLKDMADTYPDGWFEKAVDETKNSPKNIRTPMKYIETILESWQTEGVNPLVRKRTKADQGHSTKAAELRESTEAKLR